MSGIRPQTATRPRSTISRHRTAGRAGSSRTAGGASSWHKGRTATADARRRRTVTADGAPPQLHRRTSFGVVLVREHPAVGGTAVSAWSLRRARHEFLLFHRLITPTSSVDCAARMHSNTRPTLDSRLHRQAMLACALGEKDHFLHHLPNVGDIDEALLRRACAEARRGSSICCRRIASKGEPRSRSKLSRSVAIQAFAPPIVINKNNNVLYHVNI